MQKHHGHCDELYADAETMLLDGRIDEVMVRMKAFLKQMERHFIIEETLLFPTVEDTTGMRQGPTQVMRMEHQQMRGVMTAIEDAIIHGRRNRSLKTVIRF